MAPQTDDTPDSQPINPVNPPPQPPTATPFSAAPDVTPDVMSVDQKIAGQSSSPFTTPESQPVAFAPQGIETRPLGPNKPRGNRKKLVAIIVAAAVLVLGVGGYAAYALWYDAPQNVVADALSQVMKAKTGTVNGSFEAVASGSNSKVKADFAFAQAESKNASFTGSLAVSTEGKTYTLKASAVGTKDSTAYLKLENVREVLNSVMGLSGVPPESLAMFDGLIDKIDGKWVVVKPSDIQQDEKADKQAECVEKAFETFQSDQKQQNEVVDAYRKNSFIVVSKNLGTETINGAMSNHYELTTDDKKARAFGEAVTKTTIFKAADKCYDGEISKSYNADETDDEDSAPDSGNTKVELWVDKWNHKPTKLKVSDTSNTKNTFQSTFSLGSKPSVTVPKADTTYNDLKTEIESIQQQIFGVPTEGEFEITEPENPVLGIQTFLPNFMPRL